MAKEIAKVKNVRNAAGVIKNPRVTEKATMVNELGVFTFDVDAKATKPEIRKAIFELYKVDPLKISIVTIRPKTIFVRGKVGKKAGGKKAYVYLKKGDTITFA